jgi:hypothetical protein
MRRAFIIQIAALFSFLAVAHGANCTNKFSGLQTCAVLNGLPVRATTAELAAVVSVFDQNIMTMYDAAVVGGLNKNEKCKAMYIDLYCASQGGSLAGPCNGTANGIWVCPEWCVEMWTECLSDASMRTSIIAQACPAVSAYIRAPCFGSNGVFGMKASSSETGARPAARWVALALALAAVRLDSMLF